MKHENEKFVYLDYIRVVAMMLVVLIHVVVIPLENFMLQMNYFTKMSYSLVYYIGACGVPLFLMISGSLLLNPEKEYTVNRVLNKLMPRIGIPLVVYGTFYAVIELIFKYKTFNLDMLAIGFWNMINGRSWGHLWYLYMLLGLYVLLPFMRLIVQNMNESMMSYGFIIAIIFGFVIPTINNMFSTKLSLNIPEPLCHMSFFYFGYYFNEIERVLKRKTTIIIISGTILIFIANLIRKQWSFEVLKNTSMYNSVAILLLTLAIFYFVKHCTEKIPVIPASINKLSDWSFGIYLIHPFFMNLLYKGFNFQPTAFPALLGIFLFGIIFIVCSIFSIYIVKLIGLSKYLT